MTQSKVSHLECSETGLRVPADGVHNLSPAGKPLLVRYRNYDVEWGAGAAGMWRYRDLLPVDDENIVSLGEVMTPLIPLSSMFGSHVLVKDEARLPTGSFKARGLAVAVSMAKQLGLRKMAMPTNGNAGAALAAYCARAGIECHVFCAGDTPEVNVRETVMQGANVYRVDGLIHECGSLVAKGVEEHGWFDCSTLKEPYRLEGKKTMGFELLEQLADDPVDAIFYPTGGGTGLIGMAKAFEELGVEVWPRLVAVQAEGCAPIVRAFEAGQLQAEAWENAHTVAAGIRVPKAIGDSLMLRAIQRSSGFAVAVSDEEILDARAEVASREGLLLCPEGAATVAAYRRAIDAGHVSPHHRVVLFNSATGLKYPMPDHARRVSTRR